MGNSCLESELEAVLKKASAVFPGCKTESCTWNDVFERIDAVKEAYDAKAPKGSFRSFIRNGKADATTLNSLCFIIPEEYGLGVLRGGLSFIFQVPLPYVWNVTLVDRLSRPGNNASRTERKYSSYCQTLSTLSKRRPRCTRYFEMTNSRRRREISTALLLIL